MTRYWAGSIRNFVLVACIRFFFFLKKCCTVILYWDVILFGVKTYIDNLAIVFNKKERREMFLINFDDPSSPVLRHKSLATTVRWNAELSNNSRDQLSKHDTTYNQAMFLFKTQPLGSSSDVETAEGVVSWRTLYCLILERGGGRRQLN